MKHITLIVTLIISVTLILLTGCNSGTKVSGTVKFDDGTPVNFGIVHFDNGRFAFFGTVKEDGTYTTDILKKGIPKGEYKVYLNGTSAKGEPLYLGGEIMGYKEVHRVHKKYRSIDDTDLHAEFTGRGTAVYDVVVKKPED